MITAAEINALMPTAILGLGSVVLLLLGAFMSDMSRRDLVYAGAAIALASALSAVLISPEVRAVGGLIGTGRFERLFSVVSGLTAFVALLLSAGYVERKPLGREEYPSLMLFAAFGMDLLGSAVSLLGVFLGLECMSLALYVLLASNRAEPLSGEAGMKYLVVGAVSTGFFAFGLALIYFASGSLGIYESMKAAADPEGMRAVWLAGWGFLLVGIGFKASLFPFHLWAPDVYEGGPAPVVAFLSTGSKAAVFAVLLRLVLASGSGSGWLMPVMAVMAVCTMAFGNVAALTQDNVKRLLAYSSVAQMGYVLVAVIAARQAGSAAALFYLIVYVAMDLGVFGVVAALTGKGRDFSDINALRGMGYTHPFRCAVFTVCVLGLAGIPPTAGFIGKFYVFLAAIRAGYAWLAVAGILAAIVSVYYYLRLIMFMYMREEGTAGDVPRTDLPGAIALGSLAGVIILVGVLPGWLIGVVEAMSL